jgi:hypothetical protein
MLISKFNSFSIQILLNIEKSILFEKVIVILKVVLPKGCWGSLGIKNLMEKLKLYTNS